MNKKIKTILFTLFVAGLLTVSCSNKDKTGPSSDNGDNGGGTTPTIPTAPTTGTGVKLANGKTFIPSAQSGADPDRFVYITQEGQAEIALKTEAEFSLKVENDGSIVVTMPQLNQIGFGGETMTIPANNIIQTKEGNINMYKIHYVKAINEGPDTIEYFELKSIDNPNNEDVKAFSFYGGKACRINATLTHVKEVKNPETEKYENTTKVYT